MNALMRTFYSTSLAGLLLFAHGAFAQEYGGITGLVTDASGKALPGVTIVATDLKKNTLSTATSGVRGHYVFPELEPGEYSIRAEASGFTPGSIQSASVRQATPLKADIVLETAPAPVASAPHTERRQIEIYKIAPGQQEPFLRELAVADEARRIAGLKPRDLYVHEDGADWDFMIIQPTELPPDKRQAYADARKKLGLLSGGRFFLEFRKFIADHTDTTAEGPTTATEWLAKLDGTDKK